MRIIINKQLGASSIGATFKCWTNPFDKCIFVVFLWWIFICVEFFAPRQSNDI